MTAVAALLGGAACGITLDDVDFSVGRVLFDAVCELARQGSGIERRLAARHFARLLRRLTGAGRGLCLLDDGTGDLRIFLEEGHQLFGDHRVDQRTHIAVAELGLGLALELRFLQLDRDDGGQALARVLALEGLVVLEQLVFFPVIVQNAGQRGLEAGLVRAALGGIDVVGEGQHQLAVAVGVLHGDLGHRGVAASLHVDDLLMQRGLGAVEMLDELTDAALVVHDLLDRLIVALVAQGDLETCVQKRLLAQTLFEHIVLVDRGFEDLRVSMEADGRAGLALARCIAHFYGRHAALKAHVVLGVTVADLGLEPVGQRVYDRRADAVQTAGDLVARAVKLAACVQHSQNDLERRNAHLRMDAAGNASAVIRDTDDVALFDRDLDVRAVARERFVDRVVDDLVHQMMQTARRGRTDVHTRALADGFQTLEDLDLVLVVGLCDLQIEHFVLDFNLFTHIKKFPFENCDNRKIAHQRAISSKNEVFQYFYIAYAFSALRWSACGDSCVRYSVSPSALSHSTAARGRSSYSSMMRPSS